MPDDDTQDNNEVLEGDEWQRRPLNKRERPTTRHQPTEPVKPADLSDPRVRESLAAVIQELPEYTPPSKPKQADPSEPTDTENDSVE